MAELTHRRALELLAQAQVHFPAIVPNKGGSGYLIYSAMKVLGHGETIGSALADARMRGTIPNLPPRPPFRGHGNTVELRGEVVATAKSRVYADRIANALNLYNPNERGI